MNPSPLFATSAAIQIHVYAALLALVIGLAQFALRRGSPWHRRFGWGWITLMVATAVSSFFIHEIRLVGLWSPIHLLSLYTLVMLVLAVRALRRGKPREHGTIMASLFVFALIGAGAFTLLPGRLMHVVIFGA